MLKDHDNCFWPKNMGSEAIGTTTCHPPSLAEAMTRLLASSSNDSLVALGEILHRGQHTLGKLWVNHLPERSKKDLDATNALLPGIEAQFREVRQHERAQLPTIVDPELLEGTTVNFPRSLVRLAWMLQHAATLLPMAGDLQAVLTSETAGVSSVHAWGLMLPSSSRVSPVTYHAVVAVRYPALCRLVNEMWELGSFASGGVPDKPPGFQLVLWDTNAKINGLVAADLETIVSQIIPDFPQNVGFANGLFVMTTATDHKNNLNRSVLKKDNARTLRVETIANSAGGTAQVAIVAQPSIGFLNGRFYSDGSPTEDTEDCLGRITVGLTRSKSLTVLVSPLDIMLGLMGMAQVVAAIAYGIRGLRRGETTWSWPAFDPNPEQENLAQMSRWSLNTTPEWTFPPLAIANQYHDRQTNQAKRERYRLILVRGSSLEWLKRERLQEAQNAYAADCTPYPTYVCLPSGLYKARNGQVVSRTGPTREILPLPGIYFFDGWRVHPTLTLPADLPQTKDTPVRGTTLAPPTDNKDPSRTPEEEARDILAAAAKNQVENGPGTRRAAVRACKYLRAIVNEYGSVIDEVHTAARTHTHTQRSKGTIAQTTQYQPTGAALPVITPALTSELLHCLSALPDPWPMAKITIDLEKPGQWVSKLTRLYFAEEYARRTVGIPTTAPAPAVEATLDEIERILPKLKARMIEFLAEWLVTLLMPATKVLEVRAPHFPLCSLKNTGFVNSTWA